MGVGIVLGVAGVADMIMMCVWIGLVKTRAECVLHCRCGVEALMSGMEVNRTIARARDSIFQYHHNRRM